MNLSIQPECHPQLTIPFPFYQKSKRIPYFPNPPIETEELDEAKESEEAGQIKTSKEKGEKITIEFEEPTYSDLL